MMEQARISSESISPGVPDTRCQLQRGAVAVEAVMLIPILVLLFTGIVFVKNATLERQQSSVLAKSCAWEIAGNGCTKVPERCGGIDRARQTVHSGDAVLEEFSLSDVKDMSEGKIKEAVFDLLDPLLEKLLAGNEFAVAELARDVPRPIQLGGGVVQVGTEYRLRCNLEEQTPIEMIKKMWKTTVEELKNEVGY